MSGILASEKDGCRTWFEADGKVSMERWYLSPYVKKPLNSKVIKSFVPELRSRKCFCVSGFLCYLCMSYKHSMYVSRIRIYAYYGYVTTCQKSR